MRHLLWILLLVSTTSIGGTNQSSFVVSAKVVANPATGKVLFDNTCAHCHTFQDMQNASEPVIRASLKQPGHLFNLSTKQVQDLVAHLQTYY